MKKTERLLDLLAYFLDANHPVSWDEIRRDFPDEYKVGTEDSCLRKFERDKSELLELGIPLKYTTETADGKAGYAVERADYYLPDAKLSDGDLALLYATGAAALDSKAFPLARDLAHALRKIGYLSGPGLKGTFLRLNVHDAHDSTAPLGHTLETLWSAISHRKHVMLTYFSPSRNETTERRVDPWGLAFRRGVWTLVGYCHLRQERRTFLAHRIRALRLNDEKLKVSDFEIPPDFSLDAYVAHWPWEHRFHPETLTTVELTKELWPFHETLFPKSKVSSHMVNAVEVAATHQEGLLRYVLSLGGGARVTAPAEAADRFRHMAFRVLKAHSQNEHSHRPSSSSRRPPKHHSKRVRA